jgi:triosephosphate isomerase (TIM)
MRTPLIAGNWKMYKTAPQAKAFVEAVRPRLDGADAADVGVCPPFLALPAVVQAAGDSHIQVFAQNMYHAEEGAFTGEVSPGMLVAAGARGAILGHSERRQHFGETDAALARKVPAALEAGLTPILCVGETQQERDDGQTDQKLRHQIQEDLARVDRERLAEVVIAYEPIWAIGTGVVATPEQAQVAIAFVRALIAERSPEQADRVRILYGGSVSAENARELLALPDVDGALVGGASLKPESFAAIVAAAAR